MDEAKRQRMIADLAKYAGDYPLVQDGDYTSNDIVEVFGLSPGDSPVDFMDRAIEEEPQLWEKVQVVSKPFSRRWFWVLRRKV